MFIFIFYSVNIQILFVDFGTFHNSKLIINGYTSL